MWFCLSGFFFFDLVCFGGYYLGSIEKHQFGVDDDHEYVELYNYGAKKVDVAAFRFVSLKQQARFTFPPGSSLAPGELRKTLLFDFFYLFYSMLTTLLRLVIIAKNTTEFKKIYPSYKGQVFGPCLGGMANGDRILLMDDKSDVFVFVFDFVRFDC